jgi:mannose-1-phosphate guanylyltransferase/mannose-6-phosphate isomerase
MSSRTIIPVILSGGAGTRLWPLSRADLPKQFLPLVGRESLLGATVARLGALPGLERPVVVASAIHAHLVAGDLADADPRLILEPAPRNTAPAVAAAALALAVSNPILLVLPADHAIEDVAAFKAAVVAGAELAAAGKLVTFGVVPTRPETGYGYIRAGDAVSEYAFEIDAFVEKPDEETAEKYVRSGQYFWNSGMFMFTAERFIEELARNEPEILDAVSAAVQGRELIDVLELDPSSFKQCPTDSIDFAVMEKTDDGVVIPLDAGWSDVGSWSALWDLSERDSEDNLLRGDVISRGSKGSLVWAEHRLVTTVDVENVVVVETADAVLVTDRNSAQGVKDIVQDLRDRSRPEASTHAHETRPWGSFQVLAAGDRYQVKRLVVLPGAKLSLQSHRHRAEEWTVVNGTALVTLDQNTTTIAEGGTISVPIEGKHRLANPGEMPLVVIEVQVGSYLGEDDIVRYADEYGRS